MRKQTVYLIRHAEATHNIKERHAVELVKKANGPKDEQERARRAVLDDESLRDAPLSCHGKLEAQHQGAYLSILHKVSSSHALSNSITSTSSSMSAASATSSSGSSSVAPFVAPRLVLVSPLRRALMTATELFLPTATTCSSNKGQSSSSTVGPKIIALEALREKRTGFAADERSSVEVLEREFPHIDFSDLHAAATRDAIPKGEDNLAVRARGRAFVQETFATAYQEESVAIVTHKGWLRELRQTVKEWVDQGQLRVDFDIDQWDQTLYKNAEIRVAQFGWDDHDHLSSIVSKSVENALASVVEIAVKHLIQKTISTQSLRALASTQSLQGLASTQSLKALSSTQSLRALCHTQSLQALADLEAEDSSSDYDEESVQDDEHDEDEDEEEDFLFYDSELDAGQQQEEQPHMLAPPLSPEVSVKLQELETEQSSPRYVAKHISFP